VIQTNVYVISNEERNLSCYEIRSLPTI
jgi:hypothetical protein